MENSSAGLNSGRWSKRFWNISTATNPAIGKKYLSSPKLRSLKRSRINSTMRYFIFFVLIAFSSRSAGQSIETVIQRGHELAVVAVAVSPDSNYVVTGRRDKSAKLWEVSTGREVPSFLCHDFLSTSGA